MENMDHWADPQQASGAKVCVKCHGIKESIVSFQNIPRKIAFDSFEEQLLLSRDWYLDLFLFILC